MPWTVTSYTLVGATTVAQISGSFAVLSGPAVYLELDDTNAGGLQYRVSNLSKELRFSWANGGAYTIIGRFTDPTAVAPYLQLDNTALFLNTLPAGPSNVYKQVIGVEANPRFRWDTNGKIEWGPGGATAVDTVLERVLAATLQVTGALRATAAPSNIADLTRKDYVDTADATKVAKAGDTMSGLLILSGNPTANLGAATKQYVDAISGGIVGGGPFTTGGVLFGAGTNNPATDAANFFWDATNHRLGLGTNAPGTLLDIANSTITLRQTGGNYSLTWANPAAARAISIPDPGGTDVFAFLSATQTFSGKTFSQDILFNADATRNVGTATVGAKRIYLRGTDGPIRFDDTTIMGATSKAGSASGTDYTKSSDATFTNVDNTNLKFTVTVPTGWKLVCSCSGTGWLNGGAIDMLLRLFDTQGSVNLAEVQLSSASLRIPFKLEAVITGDGNSHTVSLQYAQTSSSATTINVTNQAAGAGGTPKMTFILMPSN